MYGHHADMSLVTVEQQELQLVLGEPQAALLVHRPDLAGDGRHDARVAGAGRGGVGEQRPVLLEQEGGLDPVRVGLGQHRGQGSGLQHGGSREPHTGIVVLTIFLQQQN